MMTRHNFMVHISATGPYGPSHQAWEDTPFITRESAIAFARVAAEDYESAGWWYNEQQDAYWHYGDSDYPEIATITVWDAESNPVPWQMVESPTGTG